VINQHSERFVPPSGTELELVRRWFTDQTTIGELFFESVFQCYILEDVVRGLKIPGETAIPQGRYEVRLTFSKRFQRTLPILCEVPNFTGIRIHPGNDKGDTKGCLLTGTVRDVDCVKGSRIAFEALFAKLEKSAGPRWITIREERT
jgi:hypothetical protein